MRRFAPLLIPAFLILAGADAPGVKVDTVTAELWRMHWPRYASMYVSVQDDFAACAKWNRNYPSSRHLSRDKVRASTKQTRTVRTGVPVLNDADAGATEGVRGVGMAREESVQIPPSDAEPFANSIPALEVGEYGYIAGATVVEVAGPLEMIVEKIRLIDVDAVEKDMEKTRRDLMKRSSARNDRRAVEVQVEYRFQKRQELIEAQDEREFDRVKLKLVGFETAGFEKGMSWPGPSKDKRTDGVQIAIVKRDLEAPADGGTKKFRSSRKVKEILVAVPASRFESRELSEEQFKQMLGQRGFDEKKFVELVQEQKKTRGDAADEWVVRILDQNRPKPADAPAPEETGRD